MSVVIHPFMERVRENEIQTDIDRRYKQTDRYKASEVAFCLSLVIFVSGFGCFSSPCSCCLSLFVSSVYFSGHFVSLCGLSIVLFNPSDHKY